jgi:hypothetical protein
LEAEEAAYREATFVAVQVASEWLREEASMVRQATTDGKIEASADAEAAVIIASHVAAQQRPLTRCAIGDCSRGGIGGGGSAAGHDLRPDHEEAGNPRDDAPRHEAMRPWQPRGDGDKGSSGGKVDGPAASECQGSDGQTSYVYTGQAPMYYSLHPQINGRPRFSRDLKLFVKKILIPSINLLIN